MIRLAAKIAILSGSTLLAACTVPPQTGQAQADAATRAACQHRAEEAYNQRNRAEIYSPPAPVNSPLSANYNPGVQDRGLSDLFAHDRMISDCVRNTGTGAERYPLSSPAPRR